MVVIERNLYDIGENPPIMQGPTVKAAPSSLVNSATTAEAADSGSYVQIQGVIDPAFKAAAASRVYVTIAGADAAQTHMY